MPLVPRHSWQPLQYGVGKVLCGRLRAMQCPWGDVCGIPLAWGLGGSGPGSAVFA